MNQEKEIADYKRSTFDSVIDDKVCLNDLPN